MEVGSLKIDTTFEVSTAQEHFRTLFQSKTKVIHQPSWLLAAPNPTYPFNEDPFSLDELEAAISKTRATSCRSPLDQIQEMPLCWPNSVGPIQ